MNKIKTLRKTKFLTYVLVGAFLLYLNSIEISYSKSLSPEQFIQEGKSLFEKGDYEQSLQKLTQAEAYFKSVQVKSKAERLSEIYFLQGLNFARQGNEKISKEMFKRALHYSSDKDYDTTLLDEHAKEIFTKAKTEFEQEFSPQAMGMQGEQYQKKGGGAGWIVLAVIAIAAVGVLTYFLLKKEKEEEPDTGTIQVNSTPTGAAIWLDGTDTGKTTNATLTDVTPGAHALKLIKEGYKAWEDTVNVNKGATTHVNATLEEELKVGKIKVNSNPTGAAIWLDGEDTGETTNKTLSNISVGAHTIKLTKNYYKDFETIVTVEENQTAIVNAKLELATVPMLISPEEGAILDNGRTDKKDNIVWDFDWSDVKDANRYHLYVIGETATIPVINIKIRQSFYHYVSKGAYIIERHRFNWKWKVRALKGHKWRGWSEVRSFDVEPVNTDPPSN